MIDARSNDAPFRTLFDEAAVGMCFVALDGSIVQANRRLGDMLGYAPEELAERVCASLTHPEDRAYALETLARMVAGDVSSAAWEKRYIRRDGEVIWCNVTLTLLHDEHGAASRFVALVDDITERRAAAQRLERSEALLRIAGRTARLGGWTCDLDENHFSWSDEACAIHEVPLGSILTFDGALACYDETSRRLLRTAIETCRRTSEPFDIELEIAVPRGKRRWVRVIGQIDVHAERIVGAVQDVTERKTTEFELVRMNRALRMLSGCNEIVVRATDERSLLADLCRLVVEEGGYAMAWVGYARDDELRTVEPMATSDSEYGYFANTRVSWAQNDMAGKGAAGRTIRSGRITLVEDIDADPDFTPWKASAQRRGFRSVLALPLRDGRRTFGTICLYATDVYHPPAAELDLLQQLADDLAFGIEHIRSQVEQRRVQEAVLKISSAVSIRTSTAFFERLISHLIDAVGADSAYISRPRSRRLHERRTLVAIFDGVTVENFDYSAEHTPARDLRADSAFVVSSRLMERYPLCPIALRTSAQAFVGWRLESSTGEPLATMAIFFRKPLDNYDFTTSTMKIFVSRAAAELERQQADARIADQASWLDEARDAIVVRGIDGRISFWNRSAERLYGWSASEACGAALDDSLFADGSELREATKRVFASGFWNGELDYRRRDGTTVRVESRWTIVRDGEGEPKSILSIDTDVTDRKAAEREIQHLAFYDTLTNLPNRPLLIARLKTALAASVRIGALLFIDLDNFKTLNDTLGHDQGDLLLQQVARRLERCVRGNDTVARIGGDEFVVLLPDVGATVDEASTNARTIAQTIAAAFIVPYVLGDYEHDSTPSIGITLFDKNDRIDDLLKQADLAMYQAKASGRNTIRFFDPLMQATVSARRALEDDIRTALRSHAFTLAFQPQLDDRDDIIGAEALVRWDHERRGPISPAEFIGLAEDSGLIVPLGRQILSMACAQLVVWSRRPATARLTLSVNVSVREFRHAEFVSQVLDVLAETGANPKALKLELTETVFVDDIEVVIAKMDALKKIGVGFSLDDFGTGYSSLSYLKRLPLDQLKIDQSFVRDVLVDTNDAVIARTIVALARNLGMDVIAEGVESLAQRDFLALHGCRAFQGFYFSRPLTAAAFDAFVDERTRKIARA